MSVASINNHKLLFWFIAAWTVLNILQAGLLNVDADEAYYWMYSTNLSWGYFDHPPLVALSIRLGESFGHGSLFTRLGTILFSAGTVYFGFKMLPEQWRNVKTYLLVFASVVLFHTYGFITTPDSSLLFFTTVFFFTYKKYLQQQSIINILLVAFSIIGLLYSKYHGILPVAFTFLSNPKLALKPSAWLIVIIVIAAFSPHLYWQYQHDWPTVRYHISERIASRYRISKTTNYILSQLFIWGPLTTIPALYWIIKKKLGTDTYSRAHVFTFFGVLIFFFLSSFRSTIEAQWTLVAGPSFVFLFHNIINTVSQKLQPTFYKLLAINIGLILIIRIFFILPGLPIDKIDGFKAVKHGKDWADSLHHYAEGTPVVFPNSYSLPALYKYYYPYERAAGYNTTDYRKTQYNISEDGSYINNKPVFAASSGKMGEENLLVRSEYADIYLHKIDSFRNVNQLKIKWNTALTKIKSGQIVKAAIILFNSGRDTIYAKRLTLSYVFLKTRKEQYNPGITIPITETSLPPGYEREYVIDLHMPKEKGNYSLIFSVIQPPFAGSFGSIFYKIKVEN